jgi:beta-phosphoglucomutase
VRGVIFDLDGVLLDSAEHHRLAWERLAVEQGVSTGDDFFREHFGRTNASILPIFLGRELDPEELRRISEHKEALFREVAHGAISLFPGVTPLLEDLKGAGWRIALGTSTPRSNVDFLFRELGLEKYLEASTSSDDVRLGKPDPEVFLKAAGKLGLPPERCVVVEDSPIGVEAALAAGMKCAAVASTHTPGDLSARTKAHLVVHRTADLDPGLLEQLLER